MVLVGTGRSIARKKSPVPTGTNQYRTLHSSGGVEVGGFRDKCVPVAQGDSNPLAPTNYQKVAPRVPPFNYALGTFIV